MLLLLPDVDMRLPGMKGRVSAVTAVDACKALNAIKEPRGNATYQ